MTSTDPGTTTVSERVRTLLDDMRSSADALDLSADVREAVVTALRYAAEEITRYNGGGNAYDGNDPAHARDEVRSDVREDIDELAARVARQAGVSS